MAIFFDDDFEPPTNFSNWILPFGSDLNITTSEHLTGTQCIHAHFPNVDGSSTSGRERSITPTTHAFYRFGYKTSVGFQLGVPNNQTKILMLLQDGTFFGGYFGMEGADNFGQGVINQVAYDTSDTTPLLTGVQMNNGVWHQVEIEYKLNTPGVHNGEIRIWIDGTLRFESTNRELIGPTPTSVNPQGLLIPSTSTINHIQIYQQSGLGEAYYDRIAVGDTRIGLVGTPTNPPAAPSGLIVHG